MTRCPNAPGCSSPAVTGHQWFLGSGWQAQRAQLYELAGEVELTVALPSGKDCTIVLRGGAGEMRKGDRLTFAADGKSVHLFDAQTEEALGE